MSASGLGMIDTRRLDEHKIDQLRAHRPGWAYRHRVALTSAQAILLLAGLTVFIGACSAGLYGYGLIASCAPLGLALSLPLIPVRGPAQWRESADPDLQRVHPVIRQRALRLKEQLPEVDFRIGELFQEHIRLDPYLLADYRGAQTVLGIWDGEVLIACA
jgi:hypothetical protein